MSTVLPASSPYLDPDLIFGPGGTIAKLLPSYEVRPQQLEMSRAVADAIEHGHHLVVEAGTGVGKSFAYLVPAIQAAVARGLKVVVSTHTISLQEQLIQKDLPFLQLVMPKPFSAVLVKGRGNYISLRRLENAVGDCNDLFSGEKGRGSQLERISSWSKDTTDGSRSDLDFVPSTPVWSEVESTAGDCLGKHCPHRGSCFYFAARQRMLGAQVLVVNHALYMTDLMLRRRGAGFLPDHDVVIFDEAHALEAVAGDHLGSSVSSSQLQWNLRRLWNDRTEKGLATRAETFLGPAWGRETCKLVEAAWLAANEFFGAVQEDMGEKVSTRRYKEPTHIPCMR